jgi:hypothetical protein
MKRYLIPSVLLRGSFYASVQNIGMRLNKLTIVIRTNLWGAKSGEKVWLEPSDSPYKNVIAAKGIYKDGKRVGTWIFTSDMAGIIQSYKSYNYDENIALIDLSDPKIMEDAFADSIKISGSLINRVKIGGFLCNIPPLVFRRELPGTIYERFPREAELDCLHTFVMGLTGAIIKHEIRVKYDNIEKGYAWDEGMPDTEFKRFIPAYYS